MERLINEKLKVVNIGLESFGETLKKFGTEYVQVDFSPSLSVSEKSKKIINAPATKEKIEAANIKATDIIQKGHPFIVGMGLALETIPNMEKDKFLHAGPPVTWERMCGPMKGAMIGAVLFEKMAKTEEEAVSLLSTGKIKFAPCHEHNTVGPMAGVVSPSMPVFIIKNETFNNFSYTTMNEGLGKVLRYGAYSPEVIERLNWMKEVLYPTLKAAILSLKKIDLKGMIAQALHMGDEVHNRNRAGTSLLYRTIAPAIVETATDKKKMVDSMNFINGNDHFFLNLSMAACKAVLDAAIGIENSSIVITMCRNGTDFGVRLAGTGKKWFVGPADIPDALYFPGYTKDDANPDIGDSSITETAGLGGLAMAAAPAIVQFVGGKASDAKNYTLDMYEICATENNVYQIPALDFRGTPTGIDVRKVIDKNLLPFINTGVAHKNPGVGQVGAGVLSAPALPFQLAYEGLSENL